MNSDYNVAVHALVFLQHKKEPLTSKELADNICTNASRVRRVMAKLVGTGIISTKEGSKDGGFALALEADKIDLAKIAQALQVEFVQTRWESGDPHKECVIASGMGALLEDIYSRMDQECYQYLKSITISDLEKKLSNHHRGTKGTKK